MTVKLTDRQLALDFGWTLNPKNYSTPFGVVHYGGSCQDDYANLRIYDQPPKGGSPVKLQASAMRSFKLAEKRLGFVIPLTGSWRACAYQAELYRSDSKRYAKPAITCHCRGLAIDVSMALSATKRAKIHRVLISLGWHQARSDEPWHYSFWVTA